MPGENEGNIRPVSPYPVAGTLVGQSEAQLNQRVTEAGDQLRRAVAESAAVQMGPRTRTVRFIKYKETPGTCVFKEQPGEGQPEIIGNLYVKKWFAGNSTSITVTVTKE